jgi:hypothetical protein
VLLVAEPVTRFPGAAAGAERLARLSRTLRGARAPGARGNRPSLVQRKLSGHRSPPVRLKPDTTYE